jgi:hypothetical protein
VLVFGQRHREFARLLAQAGNEGAHRLDAAVEHHLDWVLDERVLERHRLRDERLIPRPVGLAPGCSQSIVSNIT